MVSVILQESKTLTFYLIHQSMKVCKRDYFDTHVDYCTDVSSRFFVSNHTIRCFLIVSEGVFFPERANVFNILIILSHFSSQWRDLMKLK